MSWLRTASLPQRLPLLFQAALLAATIVYSAVLWIQIAAATFASCAIQKEAPEALQKLVATLDATITLGIQLSTTLVGVGAAALLGFKTGLMLTPTVRALLLSSILMFTQSALCASYWKYGVAQAWLISCLDLVATSYLNSRFVAQTYFFFAGLFLLGILVVFVAFAREVPPEVAKS
jgi:hypothetical protein